MTDELRSRRERRTMSLRIDSICDAFEAQWRAGARPRLEDFLAQADGAERLALLRELLACEIDRRRAAGEGVDPLEFVARLPEYAEQVRILVAAADTLIASDSLDARSQPVRKCPASSALELTPLFRAVPKEELLAQMELRQFAPGDYLMRQGETGDSLMVITEGQVEIRSRGGDGPQQWIDRSVRGDVLGEMSLLTNEPRTADAIAMDHVDALVLPADRFHDLARRHPELSVLLSELVSQRLGKPDRDALTDKVLDRYRIRRRLGRGGMAIVYHADGLDGQGPVALKMMSHRLVYDRIALARFEQEAAVMQSLKHAGIVQLFGRFAAFHTYFLVLEYFPGRTLDDVLRENGPLEEPAARSALGQLAAALACAHEAGVIHRDLKPANIMLAENGQLKLMDFGLAEPVSAGRFAGRIAGTPRYMAPEQRLGESVGPEADLFAFGCLAYELVTGQPLFPGSTDDELARDFSEWQVPDVRRERPEVSEELAGVVSGALHPHPRRRRLDLAQIASWASGR